MRILVVEDEKKLADSIKRGLEKHTYAVDVAYDGNEGLLMATDSIYDLVILDRMLPGTDGIDILEQMREKKIMTPVLFLTAKDKILDRAYGLNAGADDYLVKPFAFVELIARVRALLRRPKEGNHVQLTYDNVVLDTQTGLVLRDGNEVALTAKEFALLEYLMSSPEQPFSKDHLIEHVWDFDADVLPNTVEVYIGYLRQKLDKKFKQYNPIIHTKRGFGYYIGVES